MKKKFNEELLEILACPVCKSEVEYNKEKNILVCKKCKREYRIEDGIPIMIVEENNK